jgi:hypothetical protein
MMNISVEEGEEGVKKSNEKKPMDVESYFFFFLKFISTIVPTMEIDNTFEMKI